MNVLVVAGGPVEDTVLVRAAFANAERVIAADSGAEVAIRYHRLPDLVVGDFDSIDAGAKAYLLERGVPFAEYPARKDKTDLHLALLAGVESGASEVTLIGLLGGERSDHGAAALLLLGRSEFANVRLRALDGAAELWVVRERVEFGGEPGDYVTLVAMTPEVTHVTTRGLEYPLEDASLTFGDSLGVSNELRDAVAKVTVGSGALLVVHQHRFPEGSVSG